MVDQPGFAYVFWRCAATVLLIIGIGAVLDFLWPIGKGKP